MNIDLMGNTLYSDSDIANAMQMIIDRKYTQAQREQLSRGTAAQKKTLTDFYATMTTLKTKVIGDRDLLKATLEHEAAELRLVQPVLDPKAVGDNGTPMYPTYKDMNGKVQPHPFIAQDKAERASAQYIINAATPEVTALAAKRLAAQAAV